jgi:hypothetical protein
MSKHTNKIWRAVAATSIAAAALGLATGCSGNGVQTVTGGFESRPATEPSKPTDRTASTVPAGVPDKSLPADEAWAKLYREAASERKNERRWGDFLVKGIGVGTFVSDAGRVQATQANEAIGGPLPVEAFDRSVESVAAYFVRELPMSPKIKAAQDKQVLAIGVIEDRSRAQSPMLDLALRSLQSKLANSEAIRDNFLVLSQSAAQGKAALAAAGAGKPWTFNDPLAPGHGNGGKGAAFGGYHPDSIYEVVGKFYQLNDLGRHRMYLKTLIEVWKPRTGETVRATEFTTEYRFHPYRCEWISAAEDDALRQAMGVKTASAR